MPCFTDSTCSRAFPRSAKCPFFHWADPFSAMLRRCVIKGEGGSVKMRIHPFATQGVGSFSVSIDSKFTPCLNGREAEEKLKAKSRRKRAKDHISRGCPVFGSQFRWSEKSYFEDKQKGNKQQEKWEKYEEIHAHDELCLEAYLSSR